LLRFREKGGKEKELPVHHKLEELLDEYLQATGLGTEPGSLLFPAVLRNTSQPSRRRLRRTDASDMLKQAGLPAHYSPHSFRATGITKFLQNDGTLEAAQRIAGHAEGPQSFMTGENRRCCWKIWREMPSSTFREDSILTIRRRTNTVGIRPKLPFDMAVTVARSACFVVN